MMMGESCIPCQPPVSQPGASSPAGDAGPGAADALVFAGWLLQTATLPVPASAPPVLPEGTAPEAPVDLPSTLPPEAENVSGVPDASQAIDMPAAMSVADSGAERGYTSASSPALSPASLTLAAQALLSEPFIGQSAGVSPASHLLAGETPALRPLHDPDRPPTESASSVTEDPLSPLPAATDLSPAPEAMPTVADAKVEKGIKTGTAVANTKSPPVKQGTPKPPVLHITAIAAKTAGAPPVETQVSLSHAPSRDETPAPASATILGIVSPGKLENSPLPLAALHDTVGTAGVTTGGNALPSINPVPLRNDTPTTVLPDLPEVISPEKLGASPLPLAAMMSAVNVKLVKVTTGTATSDRIPPASSAEPPTSALMPAAEVPVTPPLEDKLSLPLALPAEKLPVTTPVAVPNNAAGDSFLRELRLTAPLHPRYVATPTPASTTPTAPAAVEPGTAKAVEPPSTAVTALPPVDEHTALPAPTHAFSAGTDAQKPVKLSSELPEVPILFTEDTTAGNHATLSPPTLPTLAHREQALIPPVATPDNESGHPELPASPARWADRIGSGPARRTGSDLPPDTPSPAGLTGAAVPAAHTAPGAGITSHEPAQELAGNASPAINILERVTAEIRAHNSGVRQEVQLRLDPPSLGTLHITIGSGSDGAITAVIETTTVAVHDLLQAHLPELRQQLADGGISVGQCLVTLQDRSHGQHMPSDKRPARGRTAPATIAATAFPDWEERLGLSRDPTSVVDFFA